jgi:hypothetical protein
MIHSDGNGFLTAVALSGDVGKTILTSERLVGDVAEMIPALSWMKRDASPMVPTLSPLKRDTAKMGERGVRKGFSGETGRAGRERPGSADGSGEFRSLR